MDTGEFDRASGLGVDEIRKGKAWAFLSYLSMILGVPLFAVPLLLRDNEFALQHAKWAGSAYVGFVAALVGGAVLSAVVSFVTCGILSPAVALSLLAFLFFVPALQGAIAALEGRVDEPIIVGEIAELLFDHISVKGGR
jgi:hypothetical protein